MPTTLTDEDVGLVKTLTDEDVGLGKPTPTIALRPPSPYEKADIAAGGKVPRTGMESGTELTSAIAQNPSGFVKSIPSIAGRAMMAPGKLMLAGAADLASEVLPDYPGGNIAALEHGEEELPAEKAIDEVAKTDPNLAVIANIGKEAAEMAPAMAAGGALPEWMNRLLMPLFTGQTIWEFPEQARQLDDEMGKPKDQQDPGKIARLKSDLIQAAVFTALVGKQELQPKGISPESVKQNVPRGTVTATEPTVEPAKSQATAEPPKTQTPPALSPNAQSAIQEKEQTIKDRIASGIQDEHLQLSITPEQSLVHPTTGKTVTIPGTVQVDEIHPDLGNTFSSNPEQLNKLGLDLPASSELTKLPMGRYTLAEARAKLSEMKGRPAERTPAQAAADAAEPNPVYSDEDWAKYQDLMKRLSAKVDPTKMMEGFAAKNKIQKELEDLKNKYKGKTPAQVTASATKPSAPTAPTAATAAPVSETTATVSATKPAEGAAAESSGDGTVEAFGGGAKPPQPPVPPAADPTPEPSPVNPQELSDIQRRKTPGLEILHKAVEGLKSLLLPSSKGPASLRAAEILGSKLGASNRRSEATAHNLRSFGRMFDRLGVDRTDVKPADNAGLKFMSDMSQGRALTGRMADAASMIQGMFKARLDLLKKSRAALQTIRENYFPGMWTKESRLAFNAAMERMVKKDFDVNKSTPKQRAQIKALVDEFIQDGTGSEKDATAYLSRRPMAGRESFRKPKVFDDIMDAAEFGLRPVSNNPIDLVMLKLAEMDKSIMAHEYFKDLKSKGELKIISPYEEVPEGWVKINDKYGTIYGKPTVTVSEYIDKTVYQGLLKVAAALGIKHERLMRFPPGPGQQALGMSYQGRNRILSRFGTETSVIAHEIGHQLDLKYGLWDLLTGVGRGSERTRAKKELRAIADETERGKYARKKQEKMAQVMEMYIHAPEKMKQIAPKIFAKFDAFVKSTPKLKAFADIKPGIALQKLTGNIYVGLPIMGYRIVPKVHGDIINNYLSSSLYNNPYFGPLYKAWMGLANMLNQSQLGGGSAFHAGFTTTEAQVSQGANVIKDLYGVVRGNRSVQDLGKSIGKSIIATVRTPIVGNSILNAWRHPDGQINPKIAQVVKAAELAGVGFKMETGLTTDQTTKMMRNWHSGQRLKAAARSPIALTELMMKPTMDFLVPRQKAGVFAEIAWRIIEQNPGKSLEELTPQFRQAGNRMDARLGQVRYNRLFIHNMAKNFGQALIRAPGWSGGTIAEIGGGFTDAGRWLSEFARTGKLPEELPDRTAYVLSLVATVTAANAALTYAFTGEHPTGLDYFAFRTGRKDEQGRDERFLFPSYMKDMLAYARHPGETLLNKLHPLMSMINDVYHNKDYYGVEIASRDASLPKRTGQRMEYVVKSFEPFWTRGARRERERGANLMSGRTVAPFFGVMPAPRSVTETPAERLAHDLMLEQIPSGPRTKEQADKSRAEAEKHKGEDFLARTVKNLSAASAVEVYEKANEKERQRIGTEIMGKIKRSKSLSEEQKDRLRARIVPASGSLSDADVGL